LNNFDKTDRAYSLALTDDLIRFWRSIKGKITPWFKYVDTGACDVTVKCS